MQRCDLSNLHFPPLDTIIRPLRFDAINELEDDDRPIDIVNRPAIGFKTKVHLEANDRAGSYAQIVIRPVVEVDLITRFEA